MMNLPRTNGRRRWTEWREKSKYYLVAAEALPEIFIRVAEAKRMMQTGEADTVGAATRLAGISRSAFYKYKDAVQPFNDMKSEHIITFYTLLKDVSGTPVPGAERVCLLRRQHPHHQPEHPHQRLRRRDHFRGDLRHGEIAGTADGGCVRTGKRDQI